MIRRTQAAGAGNILLVPVFFLPTRLLLTQNWPDSDLTNLNRVLLCFVLPCFFLGGGGRFTVFNRLRKGYASYSMVLKSWACTRVGNIVVSRKTDRHTHTYSCKEVEQRPAEMFLRSLSVAAERAMIYGSGTLINNYFQAITNRFYGRVLRPVDDARCEIGRRRRPYE